MAENVKGEQNHVAAAHNYEQRIKVENEAAMVSYGIRVSEESLTDMLVCFSWVILSSIVYDILV